MSPVQAPGTRAPSGEGPVASVAREVHSPLSGRSGCSAVTAPPLAGRAVTVTSEARALAFPCPDGRGHVCLGEAGTGLGCAGAAGAPCSGRCCLPGGAGEGAADLGTWSMFSSQQRTGEKRILLFSGTTQ